MPKGNGMATSEFDTNQILSAIDRVNEKLDNIKDSLHSVQSDMNGRFSGLTEWKISQEDAIEDLKTNFKALDTARQEMEKEFAANRAKDKIVTFIGTTILTLAGSVATHIFLHTVTK